MSSLVFTFIGFRSEGVRKALELQSAMCPREVGGRYGCTKRFDWVALTFFKRRQIICQFTSCKADVSF